MNPLTLEWVDKAEGDFGTAEREFAVPTDANYDAVCFHSQQCAEKYLKARLQESNVPFGKTHDLPTLLNLVVPVEPAWAALLTDMQTMSAFAVAYRYPGDSADEKDAEDVLNRCRGFREIARKSLRL